MYGRALDCQDLNDYEWLWHDPLLQALAGQRDLTAVGSSCILPAPGKSDLVIIPWIRAVLDSVIRATP